MDPAVDLGVAALKAPVGTNVLRGEGLRARVTDAGGGRRVIVENAKEVRVQALWSFPPSHDPGRLYPPWVPFVPNTEVAIRRDPTTITATWQFTTAEVVALRKATTELLRDDTGAPRAFVAERPIESVEDLQAAFGEAWQHLSAEVQGVAERTFLGLPSDQDEALAEQLDQARQKVIQWHLDRGWSEGDLGVVGPMTQLELLGAEGVRRILTASKVHGIAQLLLIESDVLQGVADLQEGGG